MAKRCEFLREQRAASALEYVIIGALIAALLVPVMVSIFNTLRSKLEAINSGL